MSDLIKKLQAGEQRALARAISWIENDLPQGAELLDKLIAKTGRAQVIGVTGPPGAGKSTLVDRLVETLVNQGKKVAVLAIDPSSPFSGGAILGDRIRMSKAAEMGVFIRSMASRGALGGLAPRTGEVLAAIEAAGYDVILLETVGVGQGEVEVVRFAQVVLLVLVPGMGDVVQVLKAGIVEIADIFVINKADHPGADQVQKELRGVMALGPKEARLPAIVQTVAVERRGIETLAQEIENFRLWAQDSGLASQRQELFLWHSFERQLAAESGKRVLELATKEKILAEVRQRLYQRRSTAARLAQEVVGKVLGRVKW